MSLLIGLAGCTWTQDTTGLFCEGSCGSNGDAGDVGDAAPVSPRKLYVLAANGEPDLQANRIRLELRLVNETDAAVKLSELTVRYYFTIDTGTEPAFQCNFISDTVPPWSCKNVTGTLPLFAPAKPTADHVFEITFTPAAGELRPFGGDSGLMKLSVSAGDMDFDQSNDYSFRGNAVPLLADRITISRSNKIIWGKAP